MRTSRNKIRYLTYSSYENITFFYFQRSAWRQPTVKESLVKKNIGADVFPLVILPILLISLFALFTLIIFVVL